jgi:hypothetical protein
MYVCSPAMAALPYVGRLDPCGIEMLDSGTREALIEEQPHRAWGKGKILSSSSREGQRLPNIFVL